MNIDDGSQTRSRPIARAYLFLLFTALCWGANAVFSRMAVGEVSPMLLVLLRWAGVLMLLVLIDRKSIGLNWTAIRPHLPFLAMMGALGYTGFNVLFYMAAYTTTAVNIGIIQGSIPVFVLLGAFLIYSDRIVPLQGVGVAVTMFGVLIVASGGDLETLTTLAFNSGDLLMLIAGLLYAGYTLGLRRFPPAPPMALFAVMAGAALLASIPLVFVELALNQTQWPTPKGLVIIALIALFPSFLAQLAFIRGVELLGPARAGIFINLVPIFASILAVLVLGESFKMFHGIALALILSGIWLSERAGK